MPKASTSKASFLSCKEKLCIECLQLHEKGGGEENNKIFRHTQTEWKVFRRIKKETFPLKISNSNHTHTRFHFVHLHFSKVYMLLPLPCERKVHSTLNYHTGSLEYILINPRINQQRERTDHIPLHHKNVVKYILNYLLKLRIPLNETVWNCCVAFDLILIQRLSRNIKLVCELILNLIRYPLVSSFQKYNKRLYV